MEGTLTKDRYGRFALAGRQLFSGDVIELLIDGVWFHVILEQYEDGWYGDFPAYPHLFRLKEGMAGRLLKPSRQPANPWK